MNEINLLHAKNVITRKTALPEQQLSFSLLVDDLAFDKQVDVLWAGEDGAWHTLAASFHGKAAAGREYWRARAAFPLTAERSLPGNIQFALRYRVAGAEYWDNNQGVNHSTQADSGIMLATKRPLQNVAFEDRLADGQTSLRVVVAADRQLAADEVSIHWTSDDWQSAHEAVAVYQSDYWQSEFHSNARNPNHYGCQIWQAELPVDDAFRIRYRIACKARQQTFTDDNFGANYTVRRRPLAVMILNLHCCQEDRQDEKLSLIARAIDELDVDLVCLQEVAELWNNGQGDWATNTARIINQRLRAPYHLVTDWSHRGFDRYREGVAVLSRLPIRCHRERYVSNSRNPLSIHSRKVVMAQVNVPYVGLVNVFSSHLSWWEDGFAEQFENLRQWAASEHSPEVSATLLCGDFNIKAGAKGYQFVVASNEYNDQYLAANSPEIFHRVFSVREAGWEHDLDQDHRIDYVFLRKGSGLAVIAGRTVFTEQDYGRVSDHFGYLMTFEPT
ncbi:MAG: endonuclease/exonuclease/phosphatase family protein [Candidatus Accumulibacter sp. UW26]|jgi:maltose 6'-phosphate phosphatase